MNPLRSGCIGGVILWAVIVGVAVALAGCQTGPSCRDNCSITMGDHDQQRGGQESLNDPSVSGIPGL